VTLIVSGPYTGPDSTVTNGVATAKELMAADRAAGHITVTAVLCAWGHGAIWTEAEGCSGGGGHRVTVTTGLCGADGGEVFMWYVFVCEGGRGSRYSGWG
jgi:hypothetical protein